ncbi:MAG: hypothetical protein VX313_00450 [Bacteroidota bacterium]|nr:hypothetical protein [Bacteroidota bacterium]
MTYERKTYDLSTREILEAYKQECKILRDMDHQNIRKVRHTMTNWLPYVSHTGHMFLYKCDMTLHEAIHDASICLNQSSTVKEIIAAVHFLHHRKSPIIHNKLTTASIFLKLEGDAHVVKLGDFHHAKMINIKNEQNFSMRYGVSQSTESEQLSSDRDDATDNALTINTQSRQVFDFFIDDLKALAMIIFTIFAKVEKENAITECDLVDFPSVEFGVLILALQKGMPTNEALFAASFHTAEEKKSLVSELSGLFKQKKSSKEAIDSECC